MFELIHWGINWPYRSRTRCIANMHAWLVEHGHVNCQPGAVGGPCCAGAKLLAMERRTSLGADDECCNTDYGAQELLLRCVSGWAMKSIYIFIMQLPTVDVSPSQVSWARVQVVFE